MKDGFLNRKFKYTYVNASMYLVLTNIIFYVLVHYTSIYIKGLPLVYWLGLIPGCVNMGWVWQFVTYMFVHNSFTHLLFNMLAIAMFGSSIERYLGSREFLCYYFVCGILGGIISYLFYLIQGSYGVVVMGASGAIYALLLLAAVFFPYSRVLVFFIIPVRIPIAVIVFILVEIFDQVVGAKQGVAHLIHLSSMAIGWVYCLVRFKTNPIKVWKQVL